MSHDELAYLDRLTMLAELERLKGLAVISEPGPGATVENAVMLDTRLVCVHYA